VKKTIVSGTPEAPRKNVLQNQSKEVLPRLGSLFPKAGLAFTG
jgi:hypothetical protein